MKKLILALTISLSIISCKKDYSESPSPFHVGDKVALNGIDPTKSPQPRNCCKCPCTVTSAYTKQGDYDWYYSIVDLNDTTQVNLTNRQLKKW